MKHPPITTILIIPQTSPRASSLHAFNLKSSVASAYRLQHSTRPCRNAFQRPASQRTAPAFYQCIRHASSAAAAAPKPSTSPQYPTSSSKPKTYPQQPSSSPKPPSPPDENDRLNPPPTTYAPPLTIPPRKPNQGRASHLWATGRAYYNFYRTGISHVRQTARLASELREKNRQPADKAGEITRAEWQIILRSRKDKLRLIPFALILLVFGEWTPVLVRWLGPVVPEACRIPSQVKREDEKREGRRRERLEAVARNMHALVPRSLAGKLVVLHPAHVRLNEIPHIDIFNLLNLSSRLDAHAWLWEFFMQPPKAVLKAGLRRKLAYLKRDDELITRDGGWEDLSAREVTRACVERGIAVLGKSEKELRDALREWFEKRTEYRD